MTDKQLRALSKTQLYTLLHHQELEIERLTAENKRLSEQQLSLEHAGSLAEASIVVGGMMQAAQTAADVYLDNIRQIEADKVNNVARMEEEARIRAMRTVELRNAEAKAQMECLVVDMLRVFDSQVNNLASTKEVLTELIIKNDLQHLIPGNKRAKK